MTSHHGGAGSWPLRSLVRDLAPVGNTALLSVTIQALHDAGVREIALVSNSALGRAAHDLVDDAGLDVRVVHIPEPANAGLARCLLAAERFVGDGPFLVELSSSATQHDRRRSVDLLVRKRLGAVVVVDADPGSTAQAIPLRSSDTQTVPHPTGVPKETLARANVFVFASEIFAATRAAIEAHRCEEIGIVDALAALVEAEGDVEAVVATGWSKRIEGAEDLLEVNRLVLESLRYGDPPERFAGSRIMGPVAIDDSATIESSVLNGPLVIAERAHITDSYIGPYSAIGTGASIEGTEIERSVVLPGASISNVGVRIEGSVIGVGARVTRELTPPRTLQLWIGQDARVSLV